MSRILSELQEDWLSKKVQGFLLHCLFFWGIIVSEKQYFLRMERVFFPFF